MPGRRTTTKLTAETPILDGVRPSRRHGRKGIAALLCLATLCVSGVGCAEQVAEPAGQSVPAGRFALLLVSYSEQRVPGSTGPHVYASGFFARHAGVDREAVLDLLNPTELLPPEAHVLPVGECVLVDREVVRSQIDEQPGASVEFLDAGPIRLGVGGETLQLTRRSPPDLFDSVSGVIYQGALSFSAPVGAGRLLLDAPGSHEVGDFFVELDVPPLPRLVRVDGRPVNSSWAAFDWTSEVEVAWLPAEVASPRLPPVSIEVQVLRPDRATTLLCKAPDTGEFTIPAEALAPLAARMTPEATAKLVTRRAVRRNFATAGIHIGEVWFTTRDSVLLK